MNNKIFDASIVLVCASLGTLIFLGALVGLFG